MLQHNNTNYSLLLILLYFLRNENLNKFWANDERDIKISLDSFNVLITSITCEFSRAWNSLDIDDSLNCMEVMKKLSSDKNTNAWRPSGKSVAEQTKCYRIQMQKIQISYFEQKIKQQNEKLEVQNIRYIVRNHFFFYSLTKMF